MIKNKILRKYRVWHTDKKRMRKNESKNFEIVEAFTGKGALEAVKIMFPDHRVTNAFLIEK